MLHTHRVLHAAMERAVKWRLVPVNPVDGVEPPKERDFPTAEQSEWLVAALIDREYELPILVGLYCGLRPTEYLAMRWRDVDRTEHMGQQVYGFRFRPGEYTLRHTVATLVLHETKDVKLVATRLGHSNEMLVLRTYGHLLPGVDRDAADRLGEVVNRRLRGDG